MIRTIITPLNTDLHIAIPQTYVGKQVEVLLYTTDEPLAIQASDPMDLATYNKEIDDAMARIDSGEYTNQEDFEKELDSW